MSTLKFMKITTYKYMDGCVHVSLLLLICLSLGQFYSRHLTLGNIKKSTQGFRYKKIKPMLLKATNKWEQQKFV